MTTASTTSTLTSAELTGDYTIDPTHSRLGFVARHAMVTKVRGSFDEFEGSAHLDFEDPTKSTATVTFAMASISTNQAQRDEHLRTSDFFDVTAYPTGRFQSTSVKVDRRRDLRAHRGPHPARRDQAGHHHLGEHRRRP